MATISFDLVSPENLIFNDEVGMIIVPGKDGDFGVLPGHSKVMSSLRPGRVMVYGEDKNLLKAFFVSGGFAEVNPEKCIVLAESVDEINEIEDSISAIANAHEAIYRAERFDEIDLGKYLHRVISPLLICESIAFEIESFNVKEKINYLVQIGLILSECANNSLKHAFKEDFPNKKISVSLEKNKNKLKITYKDNGKGYPETVLKEQETQDSFGLSLINSLAQQVNGKVTLSNNKGAQSELEIITETN